MNKYKCAKKIHKLPLLVCSQEGAWMVEDADLVDIWYLKLQPKLLVDF